ncbi:MAG: hypothetical protein H0W08_08955 [Acidobacteria bacterium]|nr:hypothetical protein [Acidobacteriota bacterium]
MYRILKTLPLAGVACALAVTMACSNSPDSPAAPGAAIPSTTDAAADGSTLKATAPTPLSPTGDTRLDSRTPTMTISNSQGRFVGASFEYEFQLTTDGGAVISSTTLAAGPGNTTWAFGGQLDRDTPYRWRARATMGSAIGPWSSSARFFTVKENRTPNPTSGRLPLPGYGAGVVAQVAGQRPDLLARSCQEHGGSWEFLDLVVDTLRLRDTRWGYNGKRGNSNDPSQDIVSYNYGSQPDEGTINVYIVDTILGHCGSPSPTWIDQTDLTINSGTIGRWTSRGRFPGSSGIQ